MKRARHLFYLAFSTAALFGSLDEPCPQPEEIVESPIQGEMAPYASMVSREVCFVGASEPLLKGGTLLSSEPEWRAQPLLAVDLADAPAERTPARRQAVLPREASKPLSSLYPRRELPSLWTVDWRHVVQGAPLIYGLLALLSLATCALWGYHWLRLRELTTLAPPLFDQMQSHLREARYREAAELCSEQPQLLCHMLTAGLAMQRHGVAQVMEQMRSTGKRMATQLWQRLALLNDIAVIAPMLGLLGTIVGMFYAFYDRHHSLENVALLFDSLGIAAGTTVAGIAVAVVALGLHALAKYQLARHLLRVEAEAESLALLIDLPPQSRSEDAE